MMEKVHGLYNAAEVANTFAFLRYGVYRNLLERMLRVRLVYANPENNGRILNYDFLNRDVLLRELSQIGIFALPYIVRNASTMLALLAKVRVFSRKFVESFSRRVLGRSLSMKNRVSSRAHGACAACHKSPPQHPYRSSCGCIFCYTCLYGIVDSGLQSEFFRLQHPDESNLLCVRCRNCDGIISSSEPCNPN